MDPPWESKDRSHQSREILAERGQRLARCVETAQRMLFELAETGARTAKTMYGGPGGAATHTPTVATDQSRRRRAVGTVAMGGAWLLQQCGIAGTTAATCVSARSIRGSGRGEFYARCGTRPATGEMVTNPSMSPENVHPNGVRLRGSHGFELLRDCSARLEASRCWMSMRSSRACCKPASETAGRQHRRSGQLQDGADWACSRRRSTIATCRTVRAASGSQINVRGHPRAAEDASVRCRSAVTTPPAGAWAGAEPVGAVGRRRTCLRDPEHAGSLPGAPIRTCSTRISRSDRRHLAARRHHGDAAADWGGSSSCCPRCRAVATGR